MTISPYFFHLRTELTDMGWLENRVTDTPVQEGDQRG